MIDRYGDDCVDFCCIESLGPFSVEDNFLEEDLWHIICELVRHREIPQIILYQKSQPIILSYRICAPNWISSAIRPTYSS